MQQKCLGRLLMPQVRQNVGVGLDERDQLLLLFEDLLEVFQVVLWVLLLLELFDNFYF